MSMTDPIADMLTRIRNALHAKHRRVDIPSSKLKKSIAKILVEEGYLDAVKYVEDGKQGTIRLYLRYDKDEQSVIRGLQRVSRPGLRKYAGSKSIPRVQGGLGIAIVSTSDGVLVDRDCRKKNVGGEVLCYVW
ncbi:MAG: 30S ribosomal protein S8 [Gemmatimonadetes bacterium]|nr:MAG: 30S ribosomal protein S8 [Gemmatimonadota bacterium]